MLSGVRTLLCTAEPFGYGPSSSLAQIVSHMATLANSSSAHTAVYLGSGHTLDFARAIAAYGGRVEGCAIGEAAGRERFVARAREADAALIVTDFEAAAAVREAGIPFAIYDPLAWYWPTIPAICRDADLYLCQEFFGVRARLADAGMRNAIVIPPLTPEIESHGERSGILISLGGLGNPYFTAAKCVDYARAVLAALRRAIEGERGPITSLTSKQIAESLPGLDVATLPPDEVHRRIASASVCLLTPGLGQLYEASALGARVVWLPPANDSQGRQLRDVIARGMAPGAVDWHEFMDVPRVDYSADQAGVMRTLSSHMERLLGDTRAQARLSACVRARMIAVREGPNPLARLAIENGRGGAVVAARILDNWVRSLGEPGVATRQLGDVAPPPQPRLGPLLVPRENRATDAAMIATIRTLHAEVDGTGFHIRVQTVDEVEALEHETDAVTTQRTELGIAEGVDVLASDAHRPRRRPIECTNEVEERGLAGSGRADDGDELAFAHLKVHVLKRVNRRDAVVGLGDVDQVDDVHGLTTLSPTRTSPATCTNPPANVPGVTFTSWWTPPRTRSTAKPPSASASRLLTGTDSASFACVVTKFTTTVAPLKLAMSVPDTAMSTATVVVVVPA